MASLRIHFGRFCLGATALALVLWPVSCIKPRLGKDRGDWFLWVDRGSLVATEPIYYPGRPYPAGVPQLTGIPVIGRFFMHNREPRSLLRPTLDFARPAWMDIPLWQIAAVWVGGWLWARRTRPVIGTCPCGYDLAGLTGDERRVTCPECGRENPGIAREGIGGGAGGEKAGV